MKHFSQNHEAIIISSLLSNIPDAKEGEIVPHRHEVINVHFMHRHFINNQEVYLQINLDKTMIHELSAEIKVIENQITEKPFDYDLPW